MWKDDLIRGCLIETLATGKCVNLEPLSWQAGGVRDGSETGTF